jgi:hypothetical protein
VQQLPALQQQLRPDELSAAAEFALTEGMRQPIMQVRRCLSCRVQGLQVSLGHMRQCCAGSVSDRRHAAADYAGAGFELHMLASRVWGSWVSLGHKAQCAEFALTEGMRQPSMQVGG